MKTKGQDLKKVAAHYLYENDRLHITVAKFMLAILVTGTGLIIVGALAPNIGRAFCGVNVNGRSPKKNERYRPERLRTELYRLKKQKYVTLRRQKDGSAKITITAKGQKYVRTFLSKDIQLSHPQKWDGKWRIILFDIPSVHDSARHAFRRKLKDLEFFQLQRSVWIIPYACEDELLYLAHMYDVEQYIEFVETERILHEKDLRKYFRMSQHGVFGQKKKPK